ncbi:hypothetical protein B5C34_08420 [Pacificimonas flava]|uniref:GH84 domain-containing protein n=2 Tax=Pacificimonas TaxID=1960290 RepID=A0A219B5C4_9SPHN|nr:MULTISPECIES: beta-N-acetylglucosaminidase domain-containing protein [Pacificimonas]MBZ6379313.1 beta-N-acetylglucosaminidase domain-containing protein [Pacificimonas aurantium]OWV33481.1 hypothetical protein B5C34_08420 [Pacificimonas flava]
MAPPLGIIEGYFGQPWSWEERTAVMRTLAPWGFSRFTYAPKADAKLRRDWRAQHDEVDAAALRDFADACRREGVSFGIGLSPFGLHEEMSADGRETIVRRTTDLLGLGAERIAILFDDMKGDIPDLAARQSRIAEWAGHAAGTAGVEICPSYYSEDPVLDRAFGRRPAGYEHALGRALPPDLGIYWTGPEVCSAEITPAHVRGVAQMFGRKPSLWDNYPVNDGPRMSRRLHLAGMSGRMGLANEIAAHDINPALQPYLSLLPCVTLAISYRDGADYDYRAATEEAAYALYPTALADDLMETRLPLQDGGLDFIDPERVTARFSRHDHPAAREIVRFAAGGYVQTAAEVQTQ